MAITKEDILEAVGSLTVMELNDLVKAFEEKFGVSASAPVMVAGAAGGAAAGGEEKLPIIHTAITHGFVNVLITDEVTAELLLGATEWKKEQNIY